MPFIPVDETVRVALVFNDSTGNEAVNVLHFKTNEFPVTPTVMNQLLDVIAAWAEAEWAVAASNEWSLVRLEARDLTTDGSFYINRTVSIPGDSVNQPLPPQDTVAISLRSIFSGRSRRGRLYHVGLSEGSNDGGYITPSAVLTLVGIYDQLRLDAIAANWRWGVVSYVVDGLPRTAGLFTDYTSVIVTDTIIDSQDKRKPKA